MSDSSMYCECTPIGIGTGEEIKIIDLRATEVDKPASDIADPCLSCAHRKGVSNKKFRGVKLGPPPSGNAPGPVESAKRKSGRWKMPTPRLRCRKRLK